MADLFKISEAASIALHAALWLAHEPERLHSSKEICARFGFSREHLVKVMQALGRAGLVQSVRGPAGGCRLAKPAKAITLRELYEAVEGPLAAPQCLLEPRYCAGRCCTLGKHLAARNEGLRRYLEKTTVATLSRVFQTREKKM